MIPIQIGIAVGTWAYPFIRAYFDSPKTLAELQEAAADGPADGYDIHHIVAQGAEAEGGGQFPNDQMNGPDNLVRIPMVKHWELNRWYDTENPEYGGLTPRQYARGKDWDTQRSVGLDGLRKVGVLAP